MAKDTEFEKEFKKLSIEAALQLRKGEPVFGTGGALQPLFERILNAALEGEMDAHLTEESRENGNRRNGKMSKQVQTPYGEVTVQTPRDRDGSFEPQTVKKRETVLADSMADKIIGMYALGSSTRDISAYFKREFDTAMSAETISAITDRVLPELEDWKSRILDPVYPICWLDAIHYKVKDDNGRTTTRAIYNVLAINKSGRKELLGMYVSHSEGSNFWLKVMTDLQNRGVQDILICCVDGLRGFPEAINSVFPDAIVQLCIVHQIRNSSRNLSYKHRKAFMKDLKAVYQAVSKDAAELALDKLDEKWGEQYPIIIRSWRENWEQLSEYFQFTPAIRKLIYTTNAVEGYHRQQRKVTKNKGVFPNDRALEKLTYLAYVEIRRKWKSTLRDWSLISQQLAIKFGDRFAIM